MTKQVILKDSGIENLSLDEVGDSVPKTNEAAIRVVAAAINRDQLTYISGRGNEAKGRNSLAGSRIGYEGVGEVIAVGPGVDTRWLGKEVAPIGPFDVYRYGMLGQTALVPADRLIEYPEGLRPAEAASLWVPYLTAYALVINGIKSGDYVAIPAGTSSVGLAAAQIVLREGGHPLLATRSQDKAGKLKQMGFDQVIVTESEDYHERIEELTHGHGTDYTFDPLGGTFLPVAASATADHGMIIEYGVIKGIEAPFPTVETLSKGLSIKGFTVNEIVTNAAALAHATKYVSSGVRDGSFVPRVAATFPLDDYRTALDEVQLNRKLGRVVILP